MNGSAATVHLIDANYDTGPVIAEHPIPVHPDDTADTLRDSRTSRIARTAHHRPHRPHLQSRRLQQLRLRDPSMTDYHLGRKRAPDLVLTIATTSPLDPDARGHEAVPAFHARASTNAGLDPRVATHLLVASVRT
jgi:hypothetical protein